MRARLEYGDVASLKKAIPRLAKKKKGEGDPPHAPLSRRRSKTRGERTFVLFFCFSTKGHSPLSTRFIKLDNHFSHLHSLTRDKAPISSLLCLLHRLDCNSTHSRHLQRKHHLSLSSSSSISVGRNKTWRIIMLCIFRTYKKNMKKKKKKNRWCDMFESKGCSPLTFVLFLL